MVAPLLDWFAVQGRDLPWRRPGVGAWAVLVCEVMSQQTPVARVLPRWQAWLDRWPRPGDLAAASPGDAVRMWDRLGYPRRALRLREAALVIAQQHGGVVPDDPAALLALPGVGPYTAAATAAFGYGARTVVLDVNVRRVLARHDGQPPPAGAPTRAEVDRAEALLPRSAARSARWNASVMELGALVCTARRPRCEVCPVRATCSSARPPAQASAPDASDARGGRVAPGARRTQSWVGTDRYVRGLLLAVLREASGTVAPEQLAVVWDDDAQSRRCLAGLVVDGLAETVSGGYRLPA